MCFHSPLMHIVDIHFLNFPLEGRRKGRWKFRGVRLLSEIHEKRLEQLWTGPWGLGDSHTTYRCAYLVPTSNSKSNQSAKCIWPKNVGFINWNTVQNIWHINKHNIAANWFLKVGQYKSTNFHNFQNGAAFAGKFVIERPQLEGDHWAFQV